MTKYLENFHFSAFKLLELLKPGFSVHGKIEFNPRRMVSTMTIKYCITMMIAVCCKFWFNFRYIRQSFPFNNVTTSNMCLMNDFLKHKFTYALLHYIRTFILYYEHRLWNTPVHSFFIFSRRNSSLDDRKWKMSGKYFIQIHVVIEYSQFYERTTIFN